LSDKGQQHPAGIVAIVGGDAQLGAGAHDAGKLGECGCRHEPALAMSRLRPGIGEQDERAPDAALGQPTQERTRIVGVQSNIGELLLLDGAQDLDDPVLERLAADEADTRIVPRLPEQVLAAAEADLQPDVRDGRREKLADAGR
jgi:hypothetical protein